MIKSELVKAYADRTISPLSGAQKAIDVVLEIMKEELMSGRPVVFKGFGKLYPHQKSDRIWRDPRNGDRVRAKNSITVRFKPCKSFLEQLNLVELNGEEECTFKDED